MKRCRSFMVLVATFFFLSLTGGVHAAEKIRVAAQATSGQIFQFLAEHKGYLQEEGIDVELVYINNGTDAFTALSSGKVDVLSTYSTGAPLIQIANGQQFTIFGGYMIIGATPVFSLPTTEYKDLESLRGKTIAIMRNGTPDVVLKGILHNAGFDIKKDVKFVEFKRNQDVMEAVRSGQVDFGSVSTGFEVQIKQAGMQVVMWPDELWPNHSCCRMLSKTEWLKNNPDALQRLLRAYLRAERDLHNEGMGIVVDLTMKHLDMPREIAESFLLSPHIQYETDPYKNSVITMWDRMKGFGYIENQEIKVENHINTALYKQVLDEMIAKNPGDPFYKKKMEMFNTHNL